MRQDVEWRARGGRDLVDDRSGVGGPTDRLRAEERDVDRAKPARGVGVAEERGGQFTAGRAPEVAALDDRRTEPEEDRFVEERPEPMTGDDRDDEVDRGRAEVDRGPDDGAGR